MWSAAVLATQASPSTSGSRRRRSTSASAASRGGLAAWVYVAVGRARQGRRANCWRSRSPRRRTSPPTTCCPRCRWRSARAPRLRVQLLQRGARARDRVLRAARPLGYLGAVVARHHPLVDAEPADRPAGDPARRHPSGDPRHGRTPAGSACSSTPPCGPRRSSDTRCRWSTPSWTTRAGCSASATSGCGTRRPADDEIGVQVRARPGRPLDRRAPGLHRARSTDRRRPAGAARRWSRSPPTPFARLELTDGDDPRRPPRPADRPAQPRHAARPGRARPAESRRPRHPDRAAVRRPRRLQARQRPVRARRRRRGAGRRRAAGSSECVRQSDTVARLGGDEFALLLEDVDPPRSARDVRADPGRARATASHVAGHQRRRRRQHRRRLRRQQRDRREHAPQRRPGDVRGQGPRQEPVRRVRTRDRPRAAPASRARRVAAAPPWRRRARARLPAGRARLHRPDHRRRGAGALEVQRRRRAAGRVHPRSPRRPG